MESGDAGGAGRIWATGGGTLTVTWCGCFVLTSLIDPFSSASDFEDSGNWITVTTIPTTPADLNLAATKIDQRPHQRLAESQRRPLSVNLHGW